MTNEEKELLKKDNEDLILAWQDWKDHPEKYTEPKYIGYDGARIAVIHENEYVVTGIIVQSKWKSQIGIANTFLRRELKPFLRLKCNHSSHKNM